MSATTEILTPAATNTHNQLLILLPKRQKLPLFGSGIETQLDSITIHFRSFVAVIT
jgi:hypothetical protein